MKKKILIFIILMIVIVITGCSNNNDTVIIYSSMEDNRNQSLREKLEEKFDNIDVKVQAMPTGNVAAKIKNEGTNIEADIVIDLETAHMANLEENFADLSDFDSSMYLEGINKSNNYFTWVKNSMSLIIDKDYFEKNHLEVPKSYKDLLKKEYKNLIAMPDPKTSGTGYAFFLNVVNIMGEKEAVNYFKKLKDNLREFTTSGSGPTNLLKQGEIVIGLGMVSQGAEAINAGYNFEIIELETGSPYNTTAAGIIKGRETDENVKKVFEWLISDFGKFDKENYMPDKILKNQESKVKNYPTNLKDADMKNVDSVEIKEKLIEVWSKVNG